MPVKRSRFQNSMRNGFSFVDGMLNVPLVGNVRPVLPDLLHPLLIGVGIVRVDFLCFSNQLAIAASSLSHETLSALEMRIWRILRFVLEALMFRFQVPIADRGVHFPDLFWIGEFPFLFCDWSPPWLRRLWLRGNVRRRSWLGRRRLLRQFGRLHRCLE